MKNIFLIIILLLVILNGCITPSEVSKEGMIQDGTKQSLNLHSTSLFEIEEVEQINEFYPGYIISIKEEILPKEFREIKFKKTTSHEFIPSPNSVYIHDSVGSGNYGKYDFLIIYQDLPDDYNVQNIIPLSLTLEEQNNDYALYSYDGFYSDTENNRYSGKIIIFNHKNKKAFILVGNLDFTTSTEYKLKEYYHLP